MWHTLIYDQTFTKIIKFPWASDLLCALDWTPWHFEIFMVPCGWILCDSWSLIIKNLKCGFLSHAATLQNPCFCGFILKHMLLMVSDTKDTFLALCICTPLVWALFSWSTIDFEAMLSSCTDHISTHLPFGHNLQSKDNRIPLAFVTDIDRDHSSEGCSVSQHEWLFCNPLLSTGQSWFP